MIQLHFMKSDENFKKSDETVINSDEDLKSAIPPRVYDPGGVSPTGLTSQVVLRDHFHSVV